MGIKKPAPNDEEWIFVHEEVAHKKSLFPSRSAMPVATASMADVEIANMVIFFRIKWFPSPISLSIET